MRTFVLGPPLAAAVAAVAAWLTCGAGVATAGHPAPPTPGLGGVPTIDAGAAFVVTPHLGVAPLAVRFAAQERSFAMTEWGGPSGPGPSGDLPLYSGHLSGGASTLYLWDFGDGSIGAGRDATHIYTRAGNYTVVLRVYDGGSVYTGDSFTVTVADGSYDVHAPVTPNEARRFLWQAGFGPRQADIDFIVASGYEAWIDNQIATPPTLMRVEDLQESINKGYGYGAESLWDDLCVEAPDQLRQRMAWALIQILVMNDPQDSSSADVLYYSSYIQRALGNYRDLLGYVTFSHQMGVFLTYIGNVKADPDTGSVPDENYAREVMQLFTIGLWKLNPDGTRTQGADGNPIPTYNNDKVKQFARVFTGFRWHEPYSGPMLMGPWDHEFGSKKLLNYPGAVPPEGVIPEVTAPGQQTEARAIADVNAAIDNLFHHPNCGPFVAELLIKRMTSSNPTPAYVARVAAAFEGRGPYGSGVRGDLAATAKAILLDPEARDPAYRANPFYGRVQEPMVIRWGLYRVLRRVDRPLEVFPFRINADTYNTRDHFGQALMLSPSVFNFYLPDYIPPLTRLATFHLFSPELQIYNDYTAMAMQGRLHDELVIRGGSTESPRYAQWRVLSADPAALVTTLNDEIACGGLGPDSRKIIAKALRSINGQTDRVRTAVWLVVNAPEFRVLK